VGMLGNMNDSRIFKFSTFYNQATYKDLFSLECDQEGVRTYIIEDKGYPLLPWLMISHKQIGM
jgi:hypothetical protein